MVGIRMGSGLEYGDLEDGAPQMSHSLPYPLIRLAGKSAKIAGSMIKN